MLTEDQVRIINETVSRFNSDSFCEHLRSACPVSYDLVFDGTERKERHDALTGLLYQVAAKAGDLSALPVPSYQKQAYDADDLDRMRRALLHSLNLTSSEHVRAWDTLARSVVSILQQGAQGLPELDVHECYERTDCNGPDDGAELHDD